MFGTTTYLTGWVDCTFFCAMRQAGAAFEDRFEERCQRMLESCVQGPKATITPC